MSAPTEYRSPSKINLGLEILRKRPDGYHDLETIFYRTSLADTVRIHATDGSLSMSVDVPGLSTGSDNLCLKAAEALRSATGSARGAHIDLVKRIPMGAGLGGGSSNAATVLVALDQLWDLRLPHAGLLSIASTLGSDVAFFLTSPIAFGSGRGEIIEPLPSLFPFWVTTVVPPVQVSTAWAYQHVHPIDRSGRASLRDRFLTARDDVKMLADILVNDFQQRVFDAFPEIRQTADRLTAAGCAIVRMSGSGSAVFGITSDRSIAERAAADVPAGCTTFVTPPLAS